MGGSGATCRIRHACDDVVPSTVAVLEDCSGVGDVAIDLPVELLITLETVRRSDFGGVLSQIAGLTAEIQLQLWLIHERGQPNSAWAPFLRTVGDFFHGPLFFDRKEIDTLAGSNAYGVCL